MHISDVALHTDTIRLGQFLKLANLVETGGQAKELIADGMIAVNGTIDTRRGKVLHDGDEVLVYDGEQPVAGARVLYTSDHSEQEDYFDERTANDDFDPEKWRNL